MSEKSKLITGQLFVRDTDAPAQDGSGRKLVMVVGIIAIPEGVPLRGEHQYTVFGIKEDIDNLPVLSLNLIVDKAIDRTELARGLLAGNLLTEPIWRV